MTIPEMKTSIPFPIVLVRAALVLLVLLVAGCDREVEGRIEVGPDDPNRAAHVVEDPDPIVAYLPETGIRGLVLNRCSTCHAVACALVGEERDDERWDEIEYSHADYVPGMSIEDRGKIFDYFKRHFGAGQPRPDIPQELLAGGCPQLEAH